MTKIATPFTKQEYAQRLANVRGRMAERDIELLLVADPANMNYLTGYDGWSFYVPQVVAVTLEDAEPWWIGRAMDAAGALLTVHMPQQQVIGYPEDLVHRPDRHPMDFVASFIRDQGWGARRIAVEKDADYFSVRACESLLSGLPDAHFVDAKLLVNWVRALKSHAEIALMRKAARIVEQTMATAVEVIEPGVRQCDAIARISAAQYGGDCDISGDMTGLCPLIMTGSASAAPHITWSEKRFACDETSAIELGGAHRHYNCALARTVHLGKPPQKLLDTAAAVEEGLEAALLVIRPGATGHEVAAAWQAVIARYGLMKESRIGYAIGLGYPPDWGEKTISLRPHEETILQENNTIHVMLGMWMKGWGLEMSETVRVTATGVECLTSFPRRVAVKD